MSRCFARTICLLTVLMVFATMVQAGGVAPEEVPPQESMTREQVTATSAQTSAAVSKARRAVVPVVEEAPVIKEVPTQTIRPKAVSAASKGSWLLGSREGECTPLSSVSHKVQNMGTFKTPQEFARKMQQRGYQAFVLDIGDVRDQVVRVKVPDLNLDLTFVRAEVCR